MNATDPSDVIGWDHPNIPAAIGISIGAGLSTALGGALVFFPEALKRVPQQLILGTSLALSAGVMIYVSFIEIYSKSLGAISEVEGITEGGAAAITTITFFAGMLFCVLLEVFVHKVMLRSDSNHAVICSTDTHAAAAVSSASSSSSSAVVASTTSTSDVKLASGGAAQSASDCCERGEHHVHAHEHEHAHEHSHSPMPAHDVEPAPAKPAIKGDLIGDPTEGAALTRMGMITALAIAVHNFPEGLATFLATLEDTKLGASLGVAIAVHNIPEGLCVAMPIYYATGSKRRAFLWSFLSGLTEPIGGILGYAALQPVFTQLVFGIIFSMVGGMMVFIVCHELLPAAHKYMDNAAKTTAWLVTGMAIMAASLVLFVI